MVYYPNVYGQGELFACSGFDSLTNYKSNFVGSLMGDKLGVLFHLKVRQELAFEINSIRDIEYRAVTGDVIDCKLIKSNGNTSYPLQMVFVSAYLLAGVTTKAAYPYCIAERAAKEEYIDNIKTNSSENEYTALAIKEENDRVYFGFGFSPASRVEAIQTAKTGLELNIASLVEERLSFFEKVEPCPTNDEKLARTYNKAFSVLRTNVMSAEGNIKGFWTTPNRVPHKDMWLWDSVFHAYGWQHYDYEFAFRVVEAVLETAHENGLIPIMASPYSTLHITQPPLLAWCVYKLYEKTNNISYIKKSYKALKGYIKWNMENKDTNKNYLYEWTLSGDRCGESGADNSCRFDAAKQMDCVDFTSFMANESKYLMKMAEILGNDEDAKYYDNLFAKIKEALNKELWDEREQIFCDRFLDGGFSRVKGLYSMLPLFAGLVSQERADIMIEKHLKNPAELYTKVLFATDAASEKTYSCDLWRGSTWVNYNYMIIDGLKKYGYSVLAREAQLSTIKEISKWYHQLGCIFEYYDSSATYIPALMVRKGPTTAPYDIRRKIFPVRDFGWTSALYIDMLHDLCKN